MLDLIRATTPIVQVVMGLLALGSVFSWAIILFKLRELRSAEADSEAFVEAYQQRPLHAVYDVARQCDRSPLAHVFSRGYVEVAQLERLRGGAAAPTPELVESVCKRLSWEQLTQSQRAERGLSFLATTGSTAPFVGLLGTVIGIMHAFEKIGKVGNASLSVVGPDISEALLATALGLFAAIPAVIAFNYLSARIGRLVERLELFRVDFEQEAAALGADPLVMNVQSSRGARRRQMADINVTPFVDVMLVLLVIFMITAPLMQQGIDIELPKTQSDGLNNDNEPLVVTVKSGGEILLQAAEVPMAELEPKLQKIFETRTNREVFLRADRRVEYGTVAQALAVLRRVGASRIGMVTEPEV